MLLLLWLWERLADGLSPSESSTARKRPASVLFMSWSLITHVCSLLVALTLVLRQACISICKMMMMDPLNGGGDESAPKAVGLQPQQLTTGLGELRHKSVVAVQFGKVDANTYIMDFNPQIVSAAQAFAVSLSTFDTKVLL